MPRILHQDLPDQSALATYVREINRTPLLSGAEEKALACRIEDGDSEARDHMVRANLRLVMNIARGYTGKCLGLQDLIEEGNLGLLRAVEGFDPSMNTRFSTYASFWIKQSMKRAIINTGKTIRVPAYMAELLSKWQRATADLHEHLGHAPTELEIAASLGLSKKKLNIIKKAIRVYKAVPQDDWSDSGHSLGETYMDAHARSGDAAMIDSEEASQVLKCVGELGDREAAVLRMRFGLDGEDPMTLKEIGSRLDLTRERVRQIESLALGILRDKVPGA
jgi:RNA polymerase primary sigma factor